MKKYIATKIFSFTETSGSWFVTNEPTRQKIKNMIEYFKKIQALIRPPVNFIIT